MPAGEKVVSLFEPHTAIIRKGSLAHSTEYGRLVWLDEVEGGIVSGYRILPGNPADSEQAQPSLAHHQQVVLQQPGHKTAARQQYERQRWFVWTAVASEARRADQWPQTGTEVRMVAHDLLQIARVQVQRA